MNSAKAKGHGFHLSAVHVDKWKHSICGVWGMFALPAPDSAGILSRALLRRLRFYRNQALKYLLCPGPAIWGRKEMLGVRSDVMSNKPLSVYVVNFAEH